MRAKYYREEPRRQPEEITEILGAIIERVGPGAGRDVSALVEEWDTIAPERWHADARPIGIRDGVLLVEVTSGAVASTLRHDTTTLVTRISERFGPGLINGVRLRVIRPPQQSKIR
jgi:hypothetical protein